MALTSEASVSYKILLLGESSVGKTSLLTRAADGCFPQSFVPTVGIDFKKKKVEIAPGKSVLLHIWDTAGQERFQSITCNYLRGAHGVLLCYDIANRDSFERIEHWMKKIAEFSSVNVDKVLVGNKSDLEDHRQVSKLEGQRLAQAHGLAIFETSAKTDDNVLNAFQHLSFLIDQRMGSATRGAASSANEIDNKKIKITFEDEEKFANDANQDSRKDADKSSCC